MAHIATPNTAPTQQLVINRLELTDRVKRAVVRQNSLRDVPLVVKYGNATLASGTTDYRYAFWPEYLWPICAFLVIAGTCMAFPGWYIAACIVLALSPMLVAARFVLLRRLKAEDAVIVSGLVQLSKECEQHDRYAHAEAIVKFVAWCCHEETYPNRVTKHQLLELMGHWIMYDDGAWSASEHRWFTLLQYTGMVKLQRVRTMMPSVYPAIMLMYASSQANRGPSDGILYEWKKRLGNQADTVRDQLASDTVIHAAHQVWQMIAEQREHPAYSRHVEHAEEMVRVVARVRRQASLYLVPAYKELEEQAEAAHASLLAVKKATNWG